MKRNQFFSGIGASVGMLILILDGRTALQGASEGIRLCLGSVIPSLFPFILLSMVLTQSLSGTHLKFLRPIGRLCAIPEGGETVLLTGFLGGYPVGAQAVGSSYRDGQLTKQDAERMLAFCSNAGPAFLFGICGALFQRQWVPWMLWGIHILSALAVAAALPGTGTEKASISPARPAPLSQTLSSAVRVTGIICGWVILFRIVTAFLTRWLLWLLPAAGQTAVIGILELANGCFALAAIESEDLRFVLCSGMLAFGGCCVAMQTASVIDGLSIRNYLLGKAAQAAVSVVLAMSVIRGAGIAAVFLLLFLLLLLREIQKKSSIRRKAIV